MTENKYDKKDMVRREKVLMAAGLKIAAYRVCDPETLEWSDLQIHMTYNNTMIAVMGIESAKLLATFISDIPPRDRDTNG